MGMDEALIRHLAVTASESVRTPGGSVHLVLDLVGRILDLVFEVVVVIAGNRAEAESRGDRQRRKTGSSFHHCIAPSQRRACAAALSSMTPGATNSLPLLRLLKRLFDAARSSEAPHRTPA